MEWEERRQHTQSEYEEERKGEAVKQVEEILKVEKEQCQWEIA